MNIYIQKIFDNFELLFAIFLFRYQIVRFLGNEYLYYIIVILSIVMFMYKRQINKYFIYLNIFVLVYITLNYIFYNQYKEEIKQIINMYIYSGIISTFIYSYCNNYKKLFNTLFIIALINIPITYTLFLNRAVNGFNYMDFGYYLLPTVLILYLKFYRDKKYVYLIMMIPLSVTIFIYGSRGATLSLLFCIFLTSFFYFKNYLTYKKIIFIIFSISIIISIIFISSQEDYLIKFNKYLNSKGIYSYAITKYVNPYESFSSGRNERYEIALKDIEKSPIIGNGIGNYTHQYGLNYIHNIILQLMDEGGVLLFLIVCYLILRFFKKLINERDINKQIIYIFLLSLTFKLIITSQYWDEPTFWIILMISISRNKNVLLDN